MAGPAWQLFVMEPHSWRYRSYGTNPAGVQHFAAWMLAAAMCAWVLLGAATAAERQVKVVVLGDSLSAGFGLPADAAFPARLDTALTAKGIAVTIINASVSGD